MQKALWLELVQNIHKTHITQQAHVPTLQLPVGGMTITVPLQQMNLLEHWLEVADIQMTTTMTQEATTFRTKLRLITMLDSKELLQDFS